MARIFLKIYVAIILSLLVLSFLVNIISKGTIQILTKDDWLIFIIALGALAITEALEESE